VYADNESEVVVSKTTRALLARLQINTIIRSKVKRVRLVKPTKALANTVTTTDRFPQPMDRPPPGVIIPKEGLPEAPRSRKAMLLHP
jgi:hypothetical protein